MQTLIFSKLNNKILIFRQCTGSTRCSRPRNNSKHFFNIAQFTAFMFLFQMLLDFFDQSSSFFFTAVSRNQSCRQWRIHQPFGLFSLIHTFSKLDFIFADQKRYTADLLKIHPDRIINAYPFRHTEISQLCFIDFFRIIIVDRQYIIIAVFVDYVDAFLGNQLIHTVHIVRSHIFYVLHRIHNFTISENTAVRFAFK